MLLGPATNKVDFDFDPQDLARNPAARWVVDRWSYRIPRPNKESEVQRQDVYFASQNYTWILISAKGCCLNEVGAIDRN
jgi:hypothetical protein